MSQKVKTNLFIDLILLILFLIAYEEKATGTAIHEWLGVVFVLFLLVHIVLHWRWLVETTRRFFERRKAGSRINYILDILIYLGFTTIIFTGLMISESFLPFLGIRSSENHFWQEIHVVSVDVTLFLVAFHFALHWKWIVNSAKRHLIDPLKKNSTSGRRPKRVTLSSVKPKPSFMSNLSGVSFSLIIILGLAGLISFGFYAAVGSNTSQLSSHERHGEFRSARGEGRNAEGFDHQERRRHHSDGELRNEQGHHGEGGHHDESTVFGMELGKNLLIFAVITLIVMGINRLYHFRKRPKLAIEG